MRFLGVVGAILAAWAFHAHALEAGEAVPDLSARRLGETGAFSLSQARGRVVYVDFWASWCGPCRQSMPLLEQLYRKLGPRGFTVIGVNKDVDDAEARRFLERVAVTFPLAADEGDRFARAFAVKAMPSGYLVDRRGVVRHVHRGFTAESAAAIERQVEALLAEAP